MTDAWSQLHKRAKNALNNGDPGDPEARAAALAVAGVLDPEAAQTAELLELAERDGDGEILKALRVTPPAAVVEWPIEAKVTDPIWGPDKPPAPLLYLTETPPDGRNGGAGVIELGTAGFLIGEGGIGKGWVALDLAVAVAAGDPNRTNSGTRWMGPQGFPIAHPGHVLFLTAEDRLRHIKRRLHALMLARGLTGPDLTRAQSRLHVVCTQDTPGMRGLRLQDDEGAQSAECIALRERLQRTAEARLREQGGDPSVTDGGVPWRLIVVDTLSRTASPDAETDQHHAAGFAELLERLTDCNPADLPGAVVIAIHHTGKGKGRKDGARQARGASALTDNARWVGVLNRHADLDDDDGRHWRVFDVAKVNHGPGIPAVYLEQLQDDKTGGVLNRRPKSEVSEKQGKGNKRPSGATTFSDEDL